jgi:hypothetical protein
MFKLIIPCYGDQSENLDNLVKSIDSQKADFEVECFFLEDEISDSFRKKLELLCGAPNNKFLVENNSGERFYALRNICRFLDSFDWSNEEDECIIGLIDGDDYLWGNDCLQNVKNEYDKGYSVVWTANEWDKFGLNHSGPYENKNKDPYSHPWVSSHFRTFKLSDYFTVAKSNFKNKKGDWFDACYDQALMLPILHNILKTGGKTKYIDKTHYIYRGNIKEDSAFRENQLEYESFIRTRGYLQE